MIEDRPRILIVDDESDSLLHLFDLLSKEGLYVEGTSNAADALAHVRRRPPAAVVADLQMPEMAGMELLVRIKKLSPGTKVVLMGPPAAEISRKSVLGMEGEELLIKPVVDAELLQVLGRVLAGATL